MFLTQREFPKLAAIDVAIDVEGVTVGAPETEPLRIAHRRDVRGPTEIARSQDVTVWRSVCTALVYSSGVNAWFSDVLETDCQLVYMPDNSRRSVNARFDQGDDIVSFADGYPIMLLGEASLGDLNARLSVGPDEGVRVPLPMNRFRPNLVVSGSAAFSEDDWKRVKIGDVVFRSTKPCERCVITTVDQSRGEFDGKEPLKTLATYRMAKNVMPERIEAFGVEPNAVLFGQNLIPETPGATLRVGDQVEILETY